MANGHGGRRKGAGAKAGVPRTKTKKAYEAIELAFEGIGGVEALTRWARENPSDFYKTIFPKIIPVQIGGDPENPLTIVNEIALRGVRPADQDAGS